MPFDIKALLGDMIKRNASDLHLNAGTPPAMRIDGKLRYIRETGVLEDDDVEQMLQGILTKAQMERYKRENELDFSFSYNNNGMEARFRGNAYVQLFKKAIALRQIPLNILSIDNLALPPILKDIAKKRRGLFLVTGPTGHGKSTTLAAILNEINNTREDHIITIEDPVEFIYKSAKCLVTQREIGADTVSFAEGLRRAMRQDPDILLIGELRDLETISVAVTAAETGHLVFGTLHTQDAAQSIDRLIDVFPHHQQAQIRFQLGAVLVGICSQQLIPRGEGMGGGRICATEILINNVTVRNCIREGKTNQIKTLLQTGMSAGMHTMEQNLANFVKSGALPLDAALGYAYEPRELQRLLS